MKVPDWIVESLGRNVQIKGPYYDGIRVWPARSRAHLVSIQAGGSEPYVTCHIVGDRTYAEESFALDAIEPIRH